MNDQTIDTVREITDYIAEPLKNDLMILALDAPGKSGANMLYRITGFDSETNSARPINEPFKHTTILFQNGSPDAFGTNGVTNEALLAIVADRLHGFQRGAYACGENGDALAHIRLALDCLKRRTRDRMQRGVEGTYAA